MNLPNWLLTKLSSEFSPEELTKIDKNWYRFNQISLSNSEEWELRMAARITLKFSA